VFLLLAIVVVVQVARGKINKQTFVKLGEIAKTVIEIIKLLLKKE